MPWRVLLLFVGILSTACPVKRNRQTGGVEASTCAPCVASLDCGSEECLQLEEESRCLRSCGDDSECVEGESCTELVTAEGQTARFCLGDACGHPPKKDEPADPCANFAPPEQSGTCCKCTERDGQCAPNNCFGGWHCDTSRCACTAPRPQCTAQTEAMKVGGPVTASINGKTGGTADRLHFAVVGDTRPNYLDDTANYPTATINGIYGAIAKLDPIPSFVVATGDYVFASTGRDEGAKQMGLYLAARSQFGGPFWPAIGNHECTGYTRSNCGPGAKDGTPQTYTAYISKMLGPIGETVPWYTRKVSAPDNSWTAKFVVIAPNAWNDTQAKWFEAELKKPTTYTFVVRHEPTFASEAPGVGPSDAIMAKYPVTLMLEGHSHTWRHDYGSKEVVIGNGGAPSTSSVPPGYTVISQRLSDGAIVVTSYSVPGKVLFSFAVKADGSPVE